jgi:hypothetical protein
VLANAQRLRLTIINPLRGAPVRENPFGAEGMLGIAMFAGGMAHEGHDFKGTAVKLRELARQVQSDYYRDQLLRIAQGFDRLAKHAEEWRLAAPRED